jgi:hypothetical protein
MKLKKPRRHLSLEREYRVLYVEDVMSVLNLGQTFAHKVISTLNKEIEAAGYAKPLGGRVSEKYFRERYYLGDTPIHSERTENR